MDEINNTLKTKNEDSNTLDMLFFPSDMKPEDINIDFSSILCFTIFYSNIVIITKDCTAFVMGFNRYREISVLLPKEIEKLTRLDIIDKNGKLWYPVSAICGDEYTLYMVSDVPNGFNKRLVYSARNIKGKYPTFLKIEKSNPIALFGGYENSAAIDTDGSIIYIPFSTRKRPKKVIKRKFLPNGEKALNLACGQYEFCALSNSGKIYISDTENKLQFVQVYEIRKKRVVEISGIYDHFFALTNEGEVYGYGLNSDYKLGLENTTNGVDEFTIITSLSKQKINSVYAGFNHSIFITKEGKVFVAGELDKIGGLKDYDLHYFGDKPAESKIKSGACFCIAEMKGTIIFKGFKPEMSPNINAKNEIKIGLFGSQGKTKIAQAFTHNLFENAFNDNDNNEYIANVEIDHAKIKLLLIDSSKYENDTKLRNSFYQQVQYLLFFFDISDSKSFDYLTSVYQEAKAACKRDFKYAIVAYGGVFSENSNKIHSKLKIKEIKQKFKCEVFEIYSNDMKTINKPFYFFFQSTNKQKEIIKTNQEHNNPFLNLNKTNINIGLFGDKSIIKTELAFRYVYGEFYEPFYLDYKSNFSNVELTKVIEVNNKVFQLALIDSTFVENIEKSFYSSVHGLLFVFNINILTSNNWMDTLRKSYIEAKEAVKGEMFFEIALCINDEEDKNQIVRLNEKIVEIKNEFKCRTFQISLKTGENLNEMFYFLAKKITQFYNDLKNKK